MTTLEDRLRRIETLELEAGGHRSLEDGACVMEDLKLLDCRCLLRADDVSEIRRRHAAGETQDSLGREFGIHPATVSRIVRHIWRKEAAQS